MKKQFLEKFSPLIATLPVLAIIYGLNLWRDWVNAHSIMVYYGYVFFVQKIAINMLFAVSLIALYWFVNIRSRPNRLGAGILIIFATILIFFPLLTALGSVRRLIYLQLNPLFPTSLLSFACVFVAVIGVFGLFRRPAKVNAAPHTISQATTNKIITPETEDKKL